MSLLDVTTEIEALLRSGPLETATIVDLFLDDEVRHYSDMFHEISIDDGTDEGLGLVPYLPMGDRIVPPDEVRETQALGSTNIELFLDSSRVSDDGDVVGAIVDAQVVQRRIRLRTVLFAPDTARTTPLWIFNVRDGVVDGLDDTIRIGAKSVLGVKIASGAFAYNERRNMTYSPADQRDLYPNDAGFDNVANLVDTVLKWRS